MAHTYPVLVYLVLVITSTTRNTIVSGAAQQFDTNLLERCPTTDNDFNTVREDIRQQMIPLIEGGNIGVTNRPSTTQAPTTSIPTYTCNGTPGWRRVVYINITDTSTTCPQGLNLTSYSKRTCGRAHTQPGCSSTTFSVGGSQYSQVCGRIRGYQFGPANSFNRYYRFQETIDGNYVDGISLTYREMGARQHIWTFAAGLTEILFSNSTPQYFSCPCDISHTTISPPPYVGNDYFCESGVNVEWRDRTGYGILFPDDPLWDGQDCLPSSTCCKFNNPPWFTKTLPSSTTDDIELRICNQNESDEDDVPLELIELYIQ